MTGTVCVGVDPGLTSGCVALLYPGKPTRVGCLYTSDSTLRDVYDYLRMAVDAWGQFRAVIEKQSAGAFISTSKSSSAKLYGSYRELRAVLVCCGVPFTEVTATQWQEALAVPTRRGSGTYKDHKRRLREHAQSTFPQERVTADNADALLIAEFCRRSEEGGGGARR